MKKISQLFLALTLFFSFNLSVLASTILPCGTTEPELLITKFSFNSSIDFIELWVVSDGNGGNGTILSGWKLGTIDAALENLSNRRVKSGEKLRFTEIGNLTATTDQIVLTNNKNEVKDSVCWVNAKPTEPEQKDFSTLKESWPGEIMGCISSSNLEKNTIFARTNLTDTNGSKDWLVEETEKLVPTPVSLPLPVSVTQISSQVSQPQELLQNLLPLATTEITLSEFLPDPEGNDEDHEWIELRNTSDHGVRLTGWQLDDIEGGSKPYVFTQESIGAESFFVLKNRKTGITLNNTDDIVRLINPEKKVTSQFSYKKTLPNMSWAMTKDGEWKLTEVLTPENENTFTIIKEGEKESSEKISDNKNLEPLPMGSAPSTIEISEIVPNPLSTDTGKEWIEIHNKTAEPVSLANWQIRNKDGKTFTIPSATLIPGNGYLILTDEKTKIRMKNSYDEIQLIDTGNMIQDQVEFEDAPESVSFAKVSTMKFEGNTQKSITKSIANWLIGTAYASAKIEEEETRWEWTKDITQGKENPQYYEIEGIIMNESGSEGNIIIQTPTQQLTLSIAEGSISPALRKTLFKRDTTIKVTARKEDEKLILEQYEIKSEKENSESSDTKSSLPKMLAATLLILSGGAGAAWYTQNYLKKTRDHDDLASSESDHTHPHKSQQALPEA